MKHTFTLLAILLLHLSVSAQEVKVIPCGHDHIMEHLENQYPGFKKKYDETYMQVVSPQKQLQSRKLKIKDTTYYFDTIYTIPVVFHILYNTTNENVNDSLVYNQLEVLNQDYNRENPDTINTRNIFKKVAGSVRYKFELAKLNPSGQATTGIIRKSTTKTYFSTSGNSADNVKFTSQGGDDAWDPAEYLNIWVCDLQVPSSGSIVLGYAYPPYGHPNWPNNYWLSDPRQGVVLHYATFGRNNPRAVGSLSASNKGRVATHEIGHYFGLRHISGDPMFASMGCSVDDYIDDTPNQASQSSFDCNFFRNSCTDAKNDLPDMVENYMDYSSERCQNMFTKKQVGIMRTGIREFRTTLASKIEIVQRMRIFDTVVYNDLKIYASKNNKVVVEVRNEDLLNTLKMDVYDASARLLYKDLAISKNESYISTINFAPGVYFFQLRKNEENGKVIRTEKLMITKN
jgi:hypothetical protein